MGKNMTQSLGWKSTCDIPANLPSLLCTDSRTIRPGQWFVPIVGAQFDGHTFIEEVIAKGAAGFFYNATHGKFLGSEIKSKGIEVKDTTTAIQDLAHYWRQQQPNLKVVGITGSSGKTTLKELCAQMLTEAGVGKTLKTEGSLNNELGVPLTLCRLTSTHRFAIIEMGARHKGDIAFLSRITDQNIGVLANVGSAHVGEFGGTDKILEAKMEIAHAPLCVYFRDDERIHLAMQGLKHKNFISFGEHPDADVRLIEQNFLGEGGVSLRFKLSDREINFSVPYFHESFPINVACALAVGKGLGLEVEKCLPGIQKFSGLKGRFQIHRHRDLTLIDDAYNANPHSMHAGLETIRQSYPHLKKLFILGDMNELGDISESAHKDVGSYIYKFFQNDLLITVGPQAKLIAYQAALEGMRPEHIASYLEVEKLIPKLATELADSQLLYVKASNSLKLNKIIDHLLSQ